MMKKTFAAKTISFILAAVLLLTASAALAEENASVAIDKAGELLSENRFQRNLGILLKKASPVFTV